MQKIKWLITAVILQWTTVAWGTLACIMFLLLSDRLDISNIKAGEVEMSFRARVQGLGLEKTPEFQHLKNLDKDDLQLFLIMGGDNARFYEFTDKRLTKEESIAQYEALSADSLIRYDHRHHENGGDTTIIYPTDIGLKLHRALVQSIYSQLR